MGDPSSTPQISTESCETAREVSDALNLTQAVTSSGGAGASDVNALRQELGIAEGLKERHRTRH